MDENTTVQTGDESIDASTIAADWNRSDPVQETAPVEADQQTPEAAPVTEGKPQETAPDATDAPDSKPADEQTYSLKHLGEEKAVSREEVIKLAQMGLDYDRQKQKNTDLAAKVDMLTAEVQKHSEYAEVLGQFAKSQEKPAEEIAAEKRQADVAEFLAEYKSIDPATIPAEVWESVKNGKTLLTAYQAYELKATKAERDRLAAEAEAAKKNAENKAKSTGSKQSAGNKPPLDQYAADWYS